MERYLHEKYRAAREAEALEEAENDAKFTPMWRQVRLPLCRGSLGLLDFCRQHQSSMQSLQRLAP